MAEGPFSPAGFDARVGPGLNGAGDLLHLLFSARTLPLFGRIGPDMAADYLSGLLIGAEIAVAVSGSRGAPVTLVGRGDLTDRYARALGIAGIESCQAPENIVARGHFGIARAAGLLT